MIIKNISLFIFWMLWYPFIHKNAAYHKEFWQGFADGADRNGRDVENRYCAYSLGKITKKEYMSYKRGWAVRYYKDTRPIAKPRAS